MCGSVPARGKRLFVLQKVQTSLGADSASIQCVFRTLVAVKFPDLQTDYSSPTNAEFKNAWSCVSVPPMYLHGADRDFFTFTHFCGRIPDAVVE